MEKYSTENEIWKDIEGYVGYYQISNFGRVRSLDRKVPYKTSGRFVKGKLLTTWLNNDGYVRVTLCTDGKNKHFTTSRLVASAFIPNPDMLPEVNHKDFNTKNNHVSNLEWCTQGENILKSSKQTFKPREVAQYTLDGTLVKIWQSASRASKDTPFDDSLIRKCCTGERKKHKGYKWAYTSLTEK